MSLVSKSQKILDTLNTVTGLKHFHLFKPASVKAPYAVWQEDSEGQSFHASNRKVEQVLDITIDYYTQEEFDATVDSIQDALSESGVAWRLDSFQYEQDTQLLHYEWLCEVI